MTKLGFNPEHVIPNVEPMMKLLVQANTPLTTQDLRNTMSTLDIIEAYDMSREIILNHITPEEVVHNRGSVIVGTGKKYRNDKMFTRFWNDINEEIEDALYMHFTRTIELSTGTKESTHPMIRRLLKLTIRPVLEEFAKFPPKRILPILDTKNKGIEGKDIFGYMSRFMSCGEVEMHTDNILVARKLLQKHCAANVPMLNRLITIQDAVLAVQKNAEEDAQFHK